MKSGLRLAGQRVLEDGADAAAANLAHGLPAKALDLATVEADRAAGYARAGRHQSDERGADQGLSGPRLSDHAEDLAATDVEAHLVDGTQGPAARDELHAEPVHLEESAVSGGAD